MKNIPRGNSGKSIQQGALSFGRGEEKTHPAAVYTRVFRCRKNGFDYLGQVQIEQDGPRVRVEIFNENYYSHFEDEKNVVLESLTTTVLGRLMKEVDSAFKNLIRSFLEAKVLPTVEAIPEADMGRSANGFDLKEIFDRLNAEYFDNKIQADVGWGRDSRKKNRSGFRFGSYDRAKKIIRLHPRLNQEFVPFTVVELTVYHEMCHQWAPSFKRNGVWRDHHPEFKAKEKEYRFYQEARRWEKQNWKKFLNPIPEKMSPATQAPAGDD
jgi:predicted SprT family Zn-dependent metalloprotease